MRLSVTFAASRLPVGYRMSILSLIKEAIKNSDPAYYQYLYEEHAGKMKPYCFGAYLKNFRFDHDLIYVDELTVTISSHDYEFMLHLYNGFVKVQDFQYKQFTLKRKKIEMPKEKRILSSKAVFQTLSPILIEDEKGKPVSPEDENYGQHFVHYVQLMLQTQFGRTLKAPLQVEPIAMKKTVIKETELTEGKNMDSPTVLYFTAYRGFLRLQGHPDDLQAIYQCGASRRRSQGYGLLELVREEVFT